MIKWTRIIAIMAVVLTGCLLAVPALAEKAEGRYIDRLQSALDESGIGSAFLGAMDENPPEGRYNVVLTDADGAVIYRRNDMWIEEGHAFIALISPFRYDYWVGDGAERAGVAIITDETGARQEAFRVVLTEETLHAENPAYKAYFPDIDPRHYVRGSEYFDKLDGLTGDLWYYFEKEYPLGKRDRLRVVDYVNWERERLDEAMGKRLVHRATGQGDLFLLYEVEEDAK